MSAKPNPVEISDEVDVSFGVDDSRASVSDDLRFSSAQLRNRPSAADEHSLHWQLQLHTTSESKFY